LNAKTRFNCSALCPPYYGMAELLKRFGALRVTDKSNTKETSNATRECCMISGNATATYTVKMTVLLGTLQDSSPLSILKGYEELLRKIFSDVDDMSNTHIERGEVAYKVCTAALGQRFFVFFCSAFA
jgi:hypothetical protein